jgi:hypothetical protein
MIRIAEGWTLEAVITQLLDRDSRNRMEEGFEKIFL